MSRERGNLILSFATGFFFGLAFFSLWERYEERKQKLKSLKEDSLKGGLNDRLNLENDWNQVGSYINNSHLKLSRELNEEAI